MSSRTLICSMAVLVAAGLAGCRSVPSTAAQVGGARMEVVAAVFPLAELARRIGLDRVAVTDLSATAADPRAVVADPATINRARVILIVGQGFQPGVERAVAGRRSVVTLGGPDAGRWLDPVGMEGLAGLVTDALIRADRAGQGAYQAAGQVYRAQLGALDIDYRTTLADCARPDLVTADAAFAPMASRYGLVDHRVSDPDIAQVVAAKRVTTVFTEPLVPAGPAVALARQAHIGTGLLETLETRTAAEAARSATYLSLMADNLAKLARAQSCPGADP